MNYIIIPKNDAKQYEKKYGWRGCMPVLISKPKNKCILPAIILDDLELIEGLPDMSGLPQLDITEITLYE